MSLAELNKVARDMVTPGKGLLAADESSGTIKRRFDAIGVECTEDNRRDYRELLFQTAEAMSNLEEIAATPGLDGIYVGPADLTFSLAQGRLTPAFDREEPEMIEALRKIVAACKAADIRAALHCGTAEYAARAIGWGFNMTTVSGDSRLLAGAAATSVKQFRELTGASPQVVQEPGMRSVY